MKLELVTHKDSETIKTNYIIEQHGLSLTGLFELFPFLNNMEFDIPSNVNLHFFVNHSFYKHQVLQHEECILITKNESAYYIFQCKYRYLFSHSNVINIHAKSLDDHVIPKKLKIKEHMNKASILYNYELLHSVLPTNIKNNKKSKI